MVGVGEVSPGAKPAAQKGSQIVGEGGRMPGATNAGGEPSSTTLQEGAGVTKPIPNVNRQGMVPTSKSVASGAQEAMKNLPPLTKKLSDQQLAQLKALGFKKGWSREQLNEAIEKATTGH